MQGCQVFKLVGGENIDAAVSHVSKAIIQFPVQADNTASGKRPAKYKYTD